MLNEYGQKAKIMTIVLVVLGLVPLIVAAVVLPQFADQVPMRYDAAGAVTRWGSRWELLITPIFALVFSLALDCLRQEAGACAYGVGRYGAHDLYAQCALRPGACCSFEHCQRVPDVRLGGYRRPLCFLGVTSIASS